MRKLFFARLFTGAVVCLSWMLSQNVATAEIQWIQSISQAQQKWNTASKPLLVYVTSDSCVYCQKLDHGTWMDPTVGDLVNNQFVKLKVDGRRNRALAQQLSVRAFPAVVVLSAQGRLMGRRDGYVNSTEMLDFLQTLDQPTASFE